MFRVERSPAHWRPQGNMEPLVTRNWRLTFRIDRTEGEILDLDYEDYHGRR